MSRLARLYATTVLLLLIAGAAYIAGQWATQPAARIGANPVPALHCEEDEVITFDQTGPTPYQLGCVQIDTVKAQP